MTAIPFANSGGVAARAQKSMTRFKMNITRVKLAYGGTVIVVQYMYASSTIINIIIVANTNFNIMAKKNPFDLGIFPTNFYISDLHHPITNSHFKTRHRVLSSTWSRHKYGI